MENQDLVWTQDNKKVVTSTRIVADIFDKRHDHVMRDVRKLIEGIPNFGDTPGLFYESSYINSQNGQEYREFLLDRDGYSLLVMGFTGRKALEWKLKFIAAFNAIERKLNNTNIEVASYQIADPVERAKRWIVEEQIRRSQAKRLEDAKPKVEFFDSVTGSTDVYDIGSVSKILNVPGFGRTNLFKFLREKGVLQQNNRPYQTYVDRGYFRCVVKKYNSISGDVHTNVKTVVYQRGIDFIRRLLKESKVA